MKLANFTMNVYNSHGKAENINICWLKWYCFKLFISSYMPLLRSRPRRTGPCTLVHPLPVKILHCSICPIIVWALIRPNVLHVVTSFSKHILFLSKIIRMKAKYTILLFVKKYFEFYIFDFTVTYVCTIQVLFQNSIKYILGSRIYCIYTSQKELWMFGRYFVIKIFVSHFFLYFTISKIFNRFTDVEWRTINSYSDHII